MTSRNPPIVHNVMTDINPRQGAAITRADAVEYVKPFHGGTEEGTKKSCGNAECGFLACQKTDSTTIAQSITVKRSA